MLTIDYSLIPLSEADRAAVEEEVTANLKSGIAPRIEKTWFGRAVVLNPDPVQIAHHIPDALRSTLRRTMLHTTEGPLNLGAERLLKEISEQEDPLRVLVIELASKFSNLGKFLHFIPWLRRQFPDLGIFLAAELPVALEKFQELMTEQGLVLMLSYPDARGNVEVKNPEELSLVVSEGPRPVTFAVPFFTQIRVAPGEGQKAEVYNLDTIRNLAPSFGVGEPQEVDTGGGRKEKMFVLDIPTRLIRDFQFRQDRGLDFHGILQDGRKVLSRDFAKKKLEFRWVPYRSVEGFMRMNPGDPLQTALTAEVKTLRVNTFSGQVSFIFRATADQISLSDVTSIGFRRGGGGSQAEPGSREAGAASDDDGDILFDGLVLPAEPGAAVPPIQKAIQHHLHGRIFRANAERSRKLRVYTSRIRVGVVGPLAGQTLKLFRRHGLESLIDAKSFHYLCDEPEHLPTYFETPRRFEEKFQELLKSLRAIIGDEGEGGVKVREFAHHLPFTLEWVDARAISFGDPTQEEMETVYKEMVALGNFIGDEFKRNFEINREQLGFFAKIEAAATAGLTAKWMADYKRETFGPPLPPEVLPDFVFFGTPAHKAENDQRYFFPSLACSELLASQKSQHLFSKVDYGFSVFLAEQMTLAEHVFRQEGIENIGALEYGDYFDSKIVEGNATLKLLQSNLQAIDSSDSPEFLEMLKEEEEAFQERCQALAADRKKVAEALRASGEAFQRLADALQAEMATRGPARAQAAEGSAGAGGSAVAGGSVVAVGSPPAGESADAAVLESVEIELKSKQLLFENQYSDVVKRLLDRVDGLKGTLETLVRAHQEHREWLRELTALHRTEQRVRLQTKAPQRLSVLKGLPVKDQLGLLHRAEVQIENIDGERQRLEGRLGQQEQRFQQSVSSVRDVMAKVLSGTVELAREREQESPHKKHIRISSYIARLEKIFRSMKAVAGKLNFGITQFEKLLGRGQKISGDLGTLRQEISFLGSMTKGGEATLPVVAAVPAGVPTVEDLERQSEHHQREVLAFDGELDAFLGELPGLMGEAGKLVADYEAFLKKTGDLHKLLARKNRFAESVEALAHRQQEMDAEQEDLPRRVRENFMPARKELLLTLFIPNAKKTIANYEHAKNFLEETLRTNFEQLRELFLDRAVYRRFNSSQFMRGVFFAMDGSSPNAPSLRNVLPAINELFRLLHFNYSKRHPAKLKGVGLKHFKHMQPEMLLDFITQQVNPREQVFSYMVLPATLDLAQAVELMNRKDKLFRGVPRLVLIFATKFKPSRILEDEPLREAFFKAQKHNIIVNIDGHEVVDNPLAIAVRLLHETLGGTFDTEAVEETSEEDAKFAFQV